MESEGKFYLGRLVDPASGERTEEPLLYDPDDLTTHAVVVGMTGSGKTGLCLDLLEEAALHRIPAIMIDPKGDITNALLHFPELRPSDFAPWVNADAARRENKSVAQAAAEVAALWRDGLAGWGIQPERLRRLQQSARFAVYTPGSDAGLPVSILSSLKAPDLPWESHKELLRERIAGTVTALLSLVGLKDIDPIRSREHILLSNIFETAWSQGQDLSLAELIMQTQSPPFEKLGVFEVATFFPDKERFALAMDLNSILAAPAFQAWIEGEPLDVARLLYDADGRPRHSVFYIAHLNDTERMFFVTLLYSAVETWMRGQKGTGSLRALVYFDEIFGYLPPVGNPPSKEPMLRLLKQARAFGVGLVLASQNPVDIDYKALSNAGTWFIGKLGTDQDKQRLLDGLSSAMGAGLDRRQYDELISALGKRVFLVRNVHEREPGLFQTRWAMNYLAGPLTRQQIPALNALAGVQLEPAQAPGAAPTLPSPQEEATLPGTETRPQVPASVAETFLPVNLTLSQAVLQGGRELPPGASSAGILYRPVLLAQAEIRFSNRKYNLDSDLRRAALVEEPDRRGNIRWEEFQVGPLEERSFDQLPQAAARFAALEAPLNEARALSALKRDFIDWNYRTAQVEVKANEPLKVYAGPEVSEEAFHRRCQEAAAEQEEAEVQKVEAAFRRKVSSVEKKLKAEERELAEDRAELAARKREELGKHAETIFSLFSGRRKSLSGSLTKRRMTTRARLDVEESEEAIADFQKELERLAEEQQEAVAAIEEKWEAIAADVSTVAVTPYKKDVSLTFFGVAWFPTHLVPQPVPQGERWLEWPAFALPP